MRLWIQKAPLMTAIALTALAGGAQAQSNSCTNATLRGDYAFTVSVQVLNADGTTTWRKGVALTHFDGAGNLSQQDYVMTLTPGHTPPGGIDTAPAFRTNETGTYSVNTDCSGGFAEIDMPPHPGGVVIKLVFVLADHARTIHTVVSSLTPPGATAPVPVLIVSNGTKVGSVPSIANADE